MRGHHPSGSRLAVAAALLGAGSFLSCSGLIGGKTVVPVTRKFIIEAEPLKISIPHSKRPYPFKVQITKFAVSRAYDRNQIVFRLSPQEMRDDRIHRWAVRPSEMITDAVEAYLKSSPALFADLRQQYLDVEPDYNLQGTINAIERYDSGDLWFARLAMSLQLVDRNNKVIWRDDFDVEEQVHVEDFSHTVSTMSRILRTRIEQYIRELDRHFLIQQLQSEGRSYEFLLDEEILGAIDTESAIDDSTEEGAGRPHPDYDIVPGKLVPE